MAQYVSHSHSYGESALHLQLTPKYRRSTFRDKTVLSACKHIFGHIAAQIGVQLVAAEFGPDHAHIFVRDWKRYSVPELAQHFKGRSSYELRKRIPEWLPRGRSFWSGGYFHETVGSVTAAARQHYIERCQKKHWIRQAALNKFIKGPPPAL